MAKYWILLKGRTVGPVSAQEAVLLDGFTPETPVKPSDKSSVGWSAAGSVPELASALNNPAPPPPPPAPHTPNIAQPVQERTGSEATLPAAAALPAGAGASGKKERKLPDSADKSAAVQARLDGLDRWLEEREKIIDGLSERILGFQKIFSKHLNEVRDQWDRERAGLRHSVEERIDRRATQLEEALGKMAATQAVLDKALRSLESEKVDFKAFLADNLRMELHKENAVSLEKLEQLLKEKTEALTGIIRKRVDEACSEIENFSPVLTSLEERAARGQVRLAKASEREEKIRRLAEEELGRIRGIAGEASSRTDKALRELAERSQAVFSEASLKIREIRREGESLRDFFAALRRDAEKERDEAFGRWKEEIAAFGSELEAIKSSREEFREVSQELRAGASEALSLHEQAAAQLKAFRRAAWEQKKELEKGAGRLLSGMGEALDARVREWEAAFAVRLEEEIKKAEGKVALDREKREEYHRGKTEELLEVLKQRVELEHSSAEEEGQKFRDFLARTLHEAETRAEKGLEEEKSRLREVFALEVGRFSVRLNKALLELKEKAGTEIEEKIAGLFTREVSGISGAIRKKAAETEARLSRDAESSAEELISGLEISNRERLEKIEAGLEERMDGLLRRTVEKAEDRVRSFSAELASGLEAKRLGVSSELAPFWKKLSSGMAAEVNASLVGLKKQMAEIRDKALAGQSEDAESMRLEIRKKMETAGAELCAKLAGLRTTPEHFWGELENRQEAAARSIEKKLAWETEKLAKRINELEKNIAAELFDRMRNKRSFFRNNAALLLALAAFAVGIISFLFR
ncbi:MAG: hypothetical protein ABIG11_03545 [bacterium]